MIYTDLIKLCGAYLSYDELMKDNPELDLSQKDYYEILEGNTMQQTKKYLKMRYMNDFENDWNKRKKIARSLIQHAQKTSNQYN